MGVCLYNEGRTPYIDNFYTSYELAQCLLEEKKRTWLEPLERIRDVPIDFLQAKLKRKEMISNESGEGYAR